MPRKYENIAGVILAGGKNSRMHGEKKLFFRYEEKTFLDCLKECMQDFDRMYLSVDLAAPYQAAGLPLIVDHYPESGPMGAVCSALEECPKEAVFIAACDMPQLKRETVRQLTETYLQHPARITVAAEGERIHALLGIYPKSILPELKRRIAEGNYRMRDFLKSRDAALVQLEQGDHSAANINSVPEYLAQIGDEPVDIETAVNLILGSTDPVSETEPVTLADALGRILAEHVRADIDRPPFPRSPLDGYAVQAADTEGAAADRPVSLTVIGKIYAGQVFDGVVGEGECIRLMTGAPIPEGADTVIRQEDTDYGEDMVKIYAAQKAYENYCDAGEDFKCGDILLSTGMRVTSMAAAVAAGTGSERLSVLRKPRVAVISTGDEMLPAGLELTPGKIYDTNLAFVTGRLTELGGTAVTGLHSMDDTEGMAALVRRLASDHDLIVTTGGVSVGEKDIMHGVLEALGARRLFWRVKLKPGAPSLAFIYENTPVICLTGNPYGVMVNFELLVRPVLVKLSGGGVPAGRKECRQLSMDSPKRGKTRRFLKGIADEERVLFAEGSQASGTIASMAVCNCFIELPAGSSGKKGETVWVHYL